MSIRAAIVLILVFSFAREGFTANGITLTGRYEYRTDPESVEMLGKLVCFYPDDGSAGLLPRPKSDRRLAWFCFRNEGQSKERLGIPGRNDRSGCGFVGEATVHVTGYAVYLGEGDDFDTALLQSVSSNSGPRALPCR